MGSLKNKRKKISKLQRSLLMKSNLSKAKSTRGKHEFFIPAVRGSLAAPQQGETITVYAHYHERGVVAPFRGSSSKGSSKDPANLARAVALNLSLLQHATQTPFEAMAASSRIKQVTKSVIELKKAAKTKLKQVKARYEGMVDKRSLVAGRHRESDLQPRSQSGRFHAGENAITWQKSRGSLLFSI